MCIVIFDCATCDSRFIDSEDNRRYLVACDQRQHSINDLRSFFQSDDHRFFVNRNGVINFLDH